MENNIKLTLMVISSLIMLTILFYIGMIGYVIIAVIFVMIGAIRLYKELKQ